MNKLNITWCWPDILNLHGDRGNVMALVRIAEKMGLEAEVHKVVNFGDEIDLDNTDILLLNPGEFKSCEYIVNAFSRIKEDLDDYIYRGGVILAVGTTGASFGKPFASWTELPLPAWDTWIWNAGNGTVSWEMT